MAGVMCERGRAEQQQDQERPHRRASASKLRPARRQRNWDKSRGAHNDWASIGGSVALERLQHQKKLLGKHGRNLAGVTVLSISVDVDRLKFNHLYESAVDRH